MISPASPEPDGDIIPYFDGRVTTLRETTTSPSPSLPASPMPESRAVSGVAIYAP
ncbi:hypothetical protein ACWEK5_20810 [Rhodococcus koreensis]